MGDPLWSQARTWPVEHTSLARRFVLWFLIFTFTLGSSLAGEPDAQTKEPVEVVDPVSLDHLAPEPPLESSPSASAPTATSEETEVSIPPEAPYADLLRRMDLLEERLAEKEKGLQAKEPKSGGNDAKPPAKDEGWLDLSTEKWNVKLGGHVQLDYVNWAQASPSIVGDQDYFEFRRLRLAADGVGYGVFDFRLQLTLEPESVGESTNVMSPDVKDAYFSMNEIPYFGRLRIGNFFVPFGLEQVTNDTNNIFLERSIPTQGVFTADREVGVALYNCTEDKNMTWATGIFIDSISEGLKERIDDAQGYRISGRVTWLPYYDEPSDGRYLVHTGAGVLFTDDQDNRVRFRTRPQIHEGPRLIDSGILDADTYVTANTEFAVVWGRVTLQSEGYVANVFLNDAGDATIGGAYAHLSYFLTGENRIYERFGQHGAQFGRNVPYTNVFWVKGARGFGAWELKARWSNLNLTTVDAGQYNDMTFGVNWYWSDRTRVMFDWIHPMTSSETVFGAVNADILGFRFDWNW